MALVLRNGQGNKNAYKTLVGAEYCGVKVEHVKEFKRSDKTHLFLNGHVFVRRNRLGKVPVLETPEGPIVESNAMARYVAKLKDGSTLCGSSVYEFAQIEYWMAFSTTEIDEVLTRWVYPRMGVGVYNAFSEQVVIDFMKNALHSLNTHLARGYKYLVGDRMTLADIVMTCDLYLGFTRVMTKSFTCEFRHVEEYFWNLVGQPAFKKFLGEVKQVESLPEMEVGPKCKFFLQYEVIDAVKRQRKNQKMDAHEEGGRGGTNQMTEAEKIDEQKLEAHEAEGVNLSGPFLGACVV
ncbi:hypothetical protein LUZ60_008276 [Juncus effusus]|nr:hypothetical protein LUZ60_008276 [Juncus effusus]